MMVYFKWDILLESLRLCYSFDNCSSHYIPRQLSLPPSSLCTSYISLWLWHKHNNLPLKKLRPLIFFQKSKKKKNHTIESQNEYVSHFYIWLLLAQNQWEKRWIQKKKKRGGKWFSPQMWLITNYLMCQKHTERIRIIHTVQDFTYEYDLLGKIWSPLKYDGGAEEILFLCRFYTQLFC